jgi:hypothetical protein
MGVKWLKECLEDGCKSVISCNFPGNRCLDLTYRGKKGEKLNYRVYTPLSTEYLVGQDVIDRVRDLGVTLLVAGHFCSVSMAAKAYAESKGIPIVTNKVFFAKIHNGESF